MRQTDKTPTVAPHVVIVGGGFGGLEATRALRAAPVRIMLIDRNNHHVFQPLLYQVATAGLSPADIASPIRAILRRQKNVEVIMGEVTGVDTGAQTVQLRGWHNETIPYDFLILATGVSYNYFGHEDWEPFAPSLKSLTDATAIRRDILLAFEAAEREPDPEKQQALLTFVLVGGGPTGVEMAGALAELASRALARDFRRIDPRKARILLLEAGPRILPAFPEPLSQAAQKALEEMGVEVRTGAPVEQVTEDGVVVGGQKIASQTVLWAAGVVGSPAGRWLGAETDRAGKVKVNPDLTVSGLPNVFVIGDTAHLEQDGKPLPGVAQVAMQQGRYVASVITARQKGAEAPPPFRYHNKGDMATVGRKFAVADLGRIKLSGLLAWCLWLGIHIFFLIGFRNRLSVLLQWAWAYFTFERGVRLITVEGDPYTRSLIQTLPAETPVSPPREKHPVSGA